MIKELLYKWFDLQPLPCSSCETLKQQLELSNFQNKQLLEKILHKDEPLNLIPKEELESIKPKLVPWHVKRQLLEAEDRERAKILKEKAEEIKSIKKKSTEELEKELGIENG